MLELEDIQALFIAPPRYPFGRYTFVSFDSADAGRAWLAQLVNQIPSARVGLDAHASGQVLTSPVYVAFTANGLRALGVDDASVSTFAEEFVAGMPARAEILGDTGPNSPEHWDGDVASDRLHAAVLLFASDADALTQRLAELEAFLAAHPGVTVLSFIDLAAANMSRPVEHFGYRDRISVVQIEGTGLEPVPGSFPPSKPGEFVLGYPDDVGVVAPLPEPEALSRNGTYLVYRKLQQHVGAFRDFLSQNAATPDEQELLAAKMMGRWRSGAPLVLAPERDDPLLGEDPLRNNDFNYGQMDPIGYAAPVGSHIRRVNPRDTELNVQRHLMVRRGLTYGPALPEGAAEDGVERGLTLLAGCARINDQFEFVQQIWVNDTEFMGIKNERDPITGAQDGTFDMTIPKKPFKKVIKGLPAFTTVKGGAYLFLPGLRALRYLAGIEQESH
jgi:Dyp-type peroxidase family